MMSILAGGACTKLAKTSKENILAYFVATPLDQDFMNRALAICLQCDIIAQCFIEHFENDCVVAGGTDPFNRKLIRWKRVEDVRDTNWRSVDEFVSNLRGEKE